MFVSSFSKFFFTFSLKWMVWPYWVLQVKPLWLTSFRKRSTTL
jgi:hypothetical protein